MLTPAYPPSVQLIMDSTKTCLSFNWKRNHFTLNEKLTKFGVISTKSTRLDIMGSINAHRNSFRYMEYRTAVQFR